jgi:hypothetical protein
VIQITAAGQPGGGWQIAVADNGIGVPAEFAEKIFVIFQRLHGRDAYPGTGIGLALCKRIVEQHGGQMFLDTTYAGGTRIYFTLPPGAAPEPASPAARPGLPASPALPDPASGSQPGPAEPAGANTGTIPEGTAHV